MSNSTLTFDLPSTLQARCQSMHGWTTDFTEQALKGYQQFMHLKLLQKDWHGAILEPTPMIDAVWTQHIMYVEHYVQACKTLGAGMISRKTDRVVVAEEEEKTFRETTTRKLLRKVFSGEQIHPIVWKYDSHFELTEKEEEEVHGSPEPPTEDSQYNKRKQPDEDDEDEWFDGIDEVIQQNKKKGTFTFQIFNYCRQNGSFFELKRVSALGKAFFVFEKQTGQNPGDYRYRFAGQWLARDKSAMDYDGMDNLSIIEAWPRGATVPKYSTK